MPRKANKTIRYCTICGDRAKGVNFNALSCMPCKAFFRRNALREEKDIVCPFNDCCPVDKVTRKFCTKCRLKKCFEAGMRKELILTEEEKRLIKEKIIRNKLKRQQQQQQHQKSQYFSLVDQQYQHSSLSSSSDGFSQDQTVQYVTPNVCSTFESALSSVRKTSQQQEQSNIEKQETTSFLHSVSALKPEEENVDEMIGLIGGEQTNLFDSNDAVTLNGFFDQNEDLIEKKNQELMYQWADWQFKYNTTSLTTTTESLNEENWNEDNGNTLIPIILSDEGCSDVNLPFILDQDDWSKSSMSSLLISDLFVNSPKQHSNSHSLEPINCKNLHSDLRLSWKITNRESDFLSFYLCECERIENANSFDPMLELTLQLTSNSFLQHFILNSNERFMIKQLRSACVLLQNPYKKIVFINQEHQLDTKLKHQCKITEFFIKRMIRMAKRLSAFTQLTHSDQVQLLKHGLIEMLALRSVLFYDPDREAWALMDDHCKLSIMVSIYCFKPCCIKYDYKAIFDKVMLLFKHEWKNDTFIFDLLTAILLFSPRAQTQNNKNIEKTKMIYLDLLRKYLKFKYSNNIEVEFILASLKKIVQIIQVFSSESIHLFANVTRLESSPLFAQLLDERKHREIDIVTPPQILDSSGNHMNFDELINESSMHQFVSFLTD